MSGFDPSPKELATKFEVLSAEENERNFADYSLHRDHEAGIRVRAPSGWKEAIP
jgi:hypothetical protein